MICERRLIELRKETALFCFKTLPYDLPEAAVVLEGPPDPRFQSETFRLRSDKANHQPSSLVPIYIFWPLKTPAPSSVNGS
jgi:hypothetical protein